MTQGDKLAYYASLGAVGTIGFLILTMILGLNFGQAFGIPMGIVSVLLGMGSAVLAVKAGFQHEVERAEARKQGRY